jgi:hypothetical protein
LSHTEAQTVFAGVHENGINDFLRAFFTARRRHLAYGSPGFVPFTTATSTRIPAISFPGIPGGIQFMVGFGFPTIDLHPATGGGSAPLPPGPEQFTLKTTVILALGCAQGGEQQLDPRETIVGFPTSLGLTPLYATIDVMARGTIITVEDSVGLNVTEVELFNVTPDALETLLECLIRMLLQAVISNIKIPLKALIAGAVPHLSLVRGPEIATDQVKLWGNV